jgi:hypothetical protein
MLTASRRLRLRSVTAGLVLVSLLGGASPGSAQSGSAQSGSAQPGSAQDDPNVALFNSRYRSGTEALAKQDFDAAIKYFQLAYAQKPEALLLYNIAQCHRKLKHNAEAITYYQSFLNTPDATDESLRAKASRYIAELRAPLPPPSPKVIYVESARAPRPGWRIGLGIALLGASSVPLGIGGRALYLDGACSDTPMGMQTRCTSLVDTKGLGGGLLAAGVLLAIGGVVTLAIPGRVLQVQRPAVPADAAAAQAKPSAASSLLLPLFNGSPELLAATRD